MNFTNEQLEMLDALVAENVMGWPQHPFMGDCWQIGLCNVVLGFIPFRQKHYWKPTRCGDAMLEVFNKMVDRMPVLARTDDGWQCTMLASDRDDDIEQIVDEDATIISWRRNVKEEAKEHPLCVALAALAAVGVDWRAELGVNEEAE